MNPNQTTLSGSELLELYHATAALKAKVKELEDAQQAMKRWMGMFEGAVIKAVQNGDRTIVLKR